MLYRARFYANLDDPRPINWPIKYPYWVTGENFENSIIVAYTDGLEYVKENWPEAIEIELGDPVDKFIFTDRFEKPDWFSDE